MKCDNCGLNGALGKLHDEALKDLDKNLCEHCLNILRKFEIRKNGGISIEDDLNKEFKEAIWDLKDNLIAKLNEKNDLIIKLLENNNQLLEENNKLQRQSIEKDLKKEDKKESSNKKITCLGLDKNGGWRFAEVKEEPLRKNSQEDLNSDYSEKPYQFELKGKLNHFEEWENDAEEDEFDRLEQNELMEDFYNNN